MTDRQWGGHSKHLYLWMQLPPPRPPPREPLTSHQWKRAWKGVMTGGPSQKEEVGPGLATSPEVGRDPLGI